MTLSAAGEDNGLLERTAELAALDRSLAKALDGQGSLVLVSGEAGIGKTALVRAFCDARRARRGCLGCLRPAVHAASARAAA